MLEVGQRHCLPELQFRAYQSFVLLFATQQKTQNEAHRWRHINTFCIIDDTDKETDEETEEETDEEIDEVSGDRVHAAIGTTLSDERLSELVSAVMADDSFSSITSILHLLVRVLLARKQWPRAPSSILDNSYLLLHKLICFTRLKNDGKKCLECGTKIQRMSGCEHGWACDIQECKSEWVAPTFCTVCLTFTESFYSPNGIGEGTGNTEGDATTPK